MQKYELIQTREIETLRQTVDRLRDELAMTRRENARLRAALERVEWMEIVAGETETKVILDSYCPWCNGMKSRGHDSDCARQTALGSGDKEHRKEQP